MLILLCFTISIVAWAVMSGDSYIGGKKPSILGLNRNAQYAGQEVVLIVALEGQPNCDVVFEVNNNVQEVTCVYPNANNEVTVTVPNLPSGPGIVYIVSPSGSNSANNESNSTAFTVSAE